MISSSQQKIDQLLERRAAEIIEIENKYQELLKHEYLARSVELKRSPHFWKRVLRNHHTLSKLFTSEDWNILEFLDDLTLDEFSSRNKVKTYKLTFDFKTNPYFSNNTLWAAVNDDEVNYYCASGIQYKEGYNRDSFDEGDEEAKKDSFFRVFQGVQEQPSFWNEGGFVYEVLNGIRIDLWEDPVKFYDSPAEFTSNSSRLFA
ncbi:unnamed protein product [Blepharisma stoltei]|uniref:Uncharacterized protein n=1 Tax=Blepharisma stoltei TaxID=1481888 RepID=A0AAU9K2E3_9CILI|nr:unnamed protein product [Blepharisma stoltei]